MTSGRTGGGGLLVCGMSSLVACVMTGIDMMSTMISTNMTSMSGVVLISIIGAPDSELPTVIDITNYLEALARDANRTLVRFRDEADLYDATALQVEDHPADSFVTCVPVTTDVELGLRHDAGCRYDSLEEHLLVRHRRGIPVDLPGCIHRDGDVLRLGLRGNVHGLRNLDLLHVLDHGNRDQEDDQQHEHDVHERSRVDLRYGTALFLCLTDTHCHVVIPLNVKRKAWRSRSLLLHTCDGSALRHAGAAHEIGMQIRREIAQALADVLVTTQQPVVADNRRNRGRETERRHDEGFTHGTGNLVDAGLAADADGHEGVQDAPHRAEQTDERRGGTDGREESEAIAHLAVDRVDRTLQRHGDPLVQIDAIGEATFMVCGSAQTIFGHGAEVVVLREAVNRFLQGARAPELLFDDLGTGLQSALIPQLRKDDVPRHGGHDQQNDQSATSDIVTLGPHRLNAVRIIDNNSVSSSVFHDFLDDKKAKRRLLAPRRREIYSALITNLTLNLTQDSAIGWPPSVPGK